MLALRTSLTVQRPASAAATLANVQCDFVAEFRWLKTLVAVEFWTPIAGIVFVRDM